MAGTQSGFSLLVLVVPTAPILKGREVFSFLLSYGETLFLPQLSTSSLPLLSATALPTDGRR